MNVREVWESLTLKEQDKVTNEIAERMIDLVIANAKTKASEGIAEAMGRYRRVPGHQNIAFTYVLNFTANNIAMAAERLIRKRKKKK